MSHRQLTGGGGGGGGAPGGGAVEARAIASAVIEAQAAVDQANAAVEPDGANAPLEAAIAESMAFEAEFEFQ